jgi:hypothetical protein
LLAPKEIHSLPSLLESPVRQRAAEGSWREQKTTTDREATSWTCEDQHLKQTRDGYTPFCEDVLGSGDISPASPLDGAESSALLPRHMLPYLEANPDSFVQSIA